MVEILERHGFIAGGKWYHFDTMHNEYRPELAGSRLRRRPGEPAALPAEVDVVRVPLHILALALALGAAAPALVFGCGPPRPFGTCARLQVEPQPRPDRPPREAAAPELPPDPDSGPAALRELSAEWWELTMEAAPTWATYLGDRRYDARLADLSDATHQRYLTKVRRLRDRAARIEPDRLGRQTRITHQVLLATLDRTLDSEACKPQLWQAANQLSGPQVHLPQLPNHHSIRDRTDLSTLLARYQAIPGYLAQLQANLQRGLDTGWTAPRPGVERALPQLDGLVATAPEASPFTTAVVYPKSWDASARAEAQGAIVAAVRGAVLPAFDRYRNWLRETYLPASRADIGASGLPGGAACYAAMIRVNTGSARTPDAIHQIGLEELDRLGDEMAAIARAVDGSADAAAFGAALRERADQYVATEEALVRVAEEAVRRATARLPEAFGRLPRTELVVKRLEPFRAAEAPAAFYYPAPDDGSRPGAYYINTHDLAARPLYNQEALAFHEAVPGHHLQIALSQELEGVPDFQRHMRSTAFTEGWALYGELLADELGLYSTPLTRFGALNYQAWRAVRLVVDTGLHEYGWSRDQAIEFMLAYTALTRPEATNEVDRYIVWPGQALAYMLGRMTFQALRAEAEARLGSQFELRDFHDEILAYGAVPLDTLRGIVDRWIAAREPPDRSTPPLPEASAP